MGYEMPFRAEDLADGTFVYWHRGKHSSSGVQEWGYDFAAVHWNSDAEKWETRARETSSNDDWYLYNTPIHAMRDGKVIAGWRNAPENSGSTLHSKIAEGYIYGGGNGLWIEHSDGSRAEYAHMIPGSVPTALCPHDDQFLPEQAASPRVEDCWPQIRIPTDEQVTVKQGQVLGRVGNVGTSSNTHLHVHVETGGTADETKSGGTPVEISMDRGLAAAKAAQPIWKSFSGTPIPSGPTLIWPPRSLVAEYARHGQPASTFRDLFTHLTNSGFWMVWIDAYNVNGTNFLNHVWRPGKGAWRAHALVDGATHQANTDQATKDGFFATFVESSVSGGKRLYSAIYVKQPDFSKIMRHGLTYDEHLAELQAATSAKLAPVCIAPSSVNGQLRYTVLYRPEPIGAWEIQSRVREAAYQAEFDKQSKAGRHPVYLSAYVHDGERFISAVFASKKFGAGIARHGLSAAAYQKEYDAALKSGMLTRAVTGGDGATSHRFAARWWA